MIEKSEIWSRGVVVGVDGSHESYHAFDWALAAAERHHATLTVTHARTVPAGPISPVPAYDPELLRDEGERILSEVLSRVGPRREGAPPVRSAPSVGAADAVLAGYSRDVDLVVVGRRGRSETRHALGSVSAATAAHARGPVAVVPTAAQGTAPERVVVGIGFDDDPSAALDLAFSEAHRCGSPVVLVHAVQPSTRAAREAGAGRDEDVRAALRGLAESWSVLHPDVECQVEVVEGDPADALLTRVTASDLLVLGGHRHPRFVGRLLGSVPDALLGDAPCVVVVAHTSRPHHEED
ncbi:MULTISPECIES: universal stress protein [unclassified Isoptericola]|uniref:universal stress protein n=1 Tax=unclassified Isoptericola TaxID=2623355 RepID=UPI00271256AD|nr:MULTISPECIES: universal stress protein [unclassified Isoptericola]MDO8145279.1 universal stress protein [Isoptericola sp. 178]MDO8148915.1 universal stress protein [Isoptericola sp. b515]MDO8151142.1 universal stress protein [Isoptericola sp. b408]